MLKRKVFQCLPMVVSSVMAGSGSSQEDNMHSLLIYSKDYRVDLYCWNENTVLNKEREN